MACTSVDEGDTFRLKGTMRAYTIGVEAMKLSIEALASVGAPAELSSWFESQFGNADVEYQSALGALARADLPDLAIALMDCIGPDYSASLSVDTTYDDPRLSKHVFAAGDLKIHGDCNLEGWIRAGAHIESDASVGARLGIVAGASIRVVQDARTDGSVRSGGRIDVDGSLSVQGHIHTGYAIAVGQALHAGADIRVGLEAQRVIDALTTIYDREDCPMEPITRALSDLLEACSGQSDPFNAFLDGCLASSLTVGHSIDVGADLSSVGAIRAGGTLRASGAIRSQGEIITSHDVYAKSVVEANKLTVKGHVRIDGDLSVDTFITVHGELSVGGDVVLGDTQMSGVSVGSLLSVGGSIKCRGPVTAVAITAGRNVAAGSLRMTGNLTVGGEIYVRHHVICSLGSISANGSILAGKSIQAGDSISAEGEVVCGHGYGVFSGTTTCSPVVSIEHRTGISEDTGTTTFSAGDNT